MSASWIMALGVWAKPSRTTPSSRTESAHSNLLDMSSPGADAPLPLLLAALLLYLLRACFELTTDDHPTGRARALADPGIGAALAAVHQEPPHAWTVNSLPQVARMSRATFARRFASLTGGPQMACVTSRRMNTAQRLLRDTDLSVQTSGAREGYTAPCALSHAIRNPNGKPPQRHHK